MRSKSQNKNKVAKKSFKCSSPNDLQQLLKELDTAGISEKDYGYVRFELDYGLVYYEGDSPEIQVVYNE